MTRTVLDDFPRPPSAGLLGRRVLEARPSESWIRLVFETRPEFLDSAGFVQGGFLAAMLDDTIGTATLIPSEGRLFTPAVDLHVTFITPARSGPMYSEGRVVHAGKDMAFLEGKLTDESGTLLARATASARRIPMTNPHVSAESLQPRIATEDVHTDRSKPQKAVIGAFQDLLRDPQPSVIRKLFTDDFRLHVPNHPDWPSGYEGAERMFTQMRERFPDLRIVAEDMFGDEERLCVRWRYINTSGEPFESIGISIYRFREGRIAEDWGVDFPLPARHPWRTAKEEPQHRASG